MSSARLTDAEIRALGWLALIDRLGPAGALRFALQTERGYGDYAKTRHRQLRALSVDELLARLAEWRRAGPGRRGARAPYARRRK